MTSGYRDASAPAARTGTSTVRTIFRDRSKKIIHIDRLDFEPKLLVSDRLDILRLNRSGYG
jgi:hypothetical protein